MPAPATRTAPAADRPAVERRQFPSSDAELRDGTADDGTPTLTFTGHAAVFNVRSLPLWDPWYGEFREVVEPAFFHPILDERRDSLDVHLVYQHDMGTTMADTLSQTLELREDSIGLKVYASLDPDDLDVQRIKPKMKRVRQMSFAFTVERDRWVIENEGTDEEVVTRYLVEGRELFDVAIVPQGAYPQTDAALRSLQRAVERGELPARLLDRHAGTGGRDGGEAAAPDVPAGGDPARLRAARARARAIRTVYPVTDGGPNR